MPHFKKLPVVIEAHYFAAEDSQQRMVEAWCGGSIKGTRLPIEERVIHIQTLEGEMEGKVGDWIIKGVAGEFYPCKPEIFIQTYTLVTGD